MSDGCSIFARLPYPFTIPRRLAVASEIATLYFLRADGILTHRVLAGEDVVGAEYMLMEPMPGKQLSSVWYGLSDKERYKVLHQIITMEAKLFVMKLPASGSIYYSRDLAARTPRIDSPGFENGLCVGPYASLK